jgi:hypothetical protein
LGVGEGICGKAALPASVKTVPAVLEVRLWGESGVAVGSGRRAGWLQLLKSILKTSTPIRSPEREANGCQVRIIGLSILPCNLLKHHAIFHCNAKTVLKQVR